MSNFVVPTLTNGNAVPTSPTHPSRIAELFDQHHDTLQTIRHGIVGTTEVYPFPYTSTTTPDSLTIWEQYDSQPPDSLLQCDPATGRLTHRHTSVRLSSLVQTSASILFQRAIAEHQQLRRAYIPALRINGSTASVVAMLEVLRLRPWLSKPERVLLRKALVNKGKDRPLDFAKRFAKGRTIQTLAKMLWTLIDRTTYGLTMRCFGRHISIDQYNWTRTHEAILRIHPYPQLAAVRQHATSDLDWWTTGIYPTPETMGPPNSLTDIQQIIESVVSPTQAPPLLAALLTQKPTLQREWLTSLADSFQWKARSLFHSAMLLAIPPRAHIQSFKRLYRLFDQQARLYVRRGWDSPFTTQLLDSLSAFVPRERANKHFDAILAFMERQNPVPWDLLDSWNAVCQTLPHSRKHFAQLVNAVDTFESAA